MKNVFTRNLKGKGVCLIVGAVVYLGLQILSATVLNSVYTFEWMSRNHYCYTWIAALVLIVFDKTILSYCVTFGTLIGTIIGELLGTYLRNIQMSGITPDMNGSERWYRELHQGVSIWAVTLLVFVAAGVIAEIVRSRRAAHKKALAA